MQSIAICHSRTALPSKDSVTDASRGLERMSPLVSASPRWSPFASVFGEAGVESAHIIPLWDGVTVRMSVAEKNLQWTLGLGHICPVFGGDEEIIRPNLTMG